MNISMDDWICFTDVEQMIGHGNVYLYLFLFITACIDLASTISYM